MRNKYDDLRVIRTKEAIRNAFTELIEEKGFEAITVKDIAKKAKINRGTFYFHYDDKYDLMEKLQTEVMEEMSNIFKKNFSKLISELNAEKKNQPSSPLSAVVLLLNFFYENRRFMKAILGPKGDIHFQTKLKGFLWKTVFQKQDFIKEENMMVPKEYLVSYVASAHLGVIQHWLMNDSKESPEEIARILSTIAIHGPFYAAGLKKLTDEI